MATALAVRSLRPERMDVEPLSDADYAACMRDLARVNRTLHVHGPVLRWLRRAIRRTMRRAMRRVPAEPVTVLDVGFGEGDLLRAVHRLGGRLRVRLRLIGVDRNPRSVGVARAATPAGMDIEYRAGDAYALEIRPDIIVSSHVAHHMDDDELVRFLRWMERTAGTGWYVSDLERRWLARILFLLLARLAGWHRIVREDGARSVERSFRRHEWERLLALAGVPPQERRIRRHPMFRLCVERLK